MKIQIDRPFAETLIAEFSELGMLAEQLKIGHRAEISAFQLGQGQLDFLYDLYTRAGPNLNGKAVQLASLKSALTYEGQRFQDGELEQLVPAITRFLVENACRGWLFENNTQGKAVPYLVARIDFTPPGEEESGRVLLELKANAMGKVQAKNLLITERDIGGKTVAEIFAGKGYFKETPSLIASYDASEARFFEWRSAYGKQFSGSGFGIFADDPQASHRTTDWSRKSRVILSSAGGQARLVNDEEILKQRDLTLTIAGEPLAKYLRKAERSDRFNARVEKDAEALHSDIPPNLFTRLPVHGYILMFHMDLHHHLWVHVDDMQPYQYQPELKDKLVLPSLQTELIDILTAEMDVLMDDIVSGKSGGTTVLCSGPAGVGKTLTAEVYSEIIQRPLYRVHSGQLGLNVGEMEKVLRETLTRAQRWGAVMLIDEADVYIKRRDDNIAANAVVGVFLRVLEYFNGLLFLTTNRVDDIDEAIISRCIAVIRYHQPTPDERYRIWQVMVEQFGLPVDDSLLQRLAELFPDACGRDIKGLSKLVAKYCQHRGLQPSEDIFLRCSIFRGMDAIEAA
ncbi:MAG: ATP-binding protein [Pseudomonadota bacterium]|mgnify:CR=1 FL=1|nr:AAA family ATPase [Pseudomonadales bacterium]MDY6919609.1 ATP-binding protein [Pseudomonadota bacterium]